jgi:hypothetical protein
MYLVLIGVLGQSVHMQCSALRSAWALKTNVSLDNGDKPFLDVRFIFIRESLGPHLSRPGRDLCAAPANGFPRPRGKMAG